MHYNFPGQPSLGSATTVRAHLLLLGWTSVAAWARAHGYERLTAGVTIRNWCDRTDRSPHGGIARRVMADLRRTLAEKVTPDEQARRAAALKRAVEQAEAAV